MKQSQARIDVPRAILEHSIEQLIQELADLPQASAQVRHIFGPNIYMRELSAARGTLLIGRSHRGPHGCLLVKGALTFFLQDGTQTQMRAPAEFQASAGRKIALVDEDMIFVNTWNTSETDVEALEAAQFDDEAPGQILPMLDADGDFEAMLAEQGASAAAVRAASLRTDDVTTLPFGAYKFRVGRSRIEGKGLIATADIAPGEFIAPGTWMGKRTPAGRYTNHARDPNACFVYGADGLAWLMAVKPIAGSRGPGGGEEITVDYRLTPRARWEQLA